MNLVGRFGCHFAEREQLQWFPLCILPCSEYAFPEGCPFIPLNSTITSSARSLKRVGITLRLELWM